VKFATEDLPMVDAGNPWSWERGLRVDTFSQSVRPARI
jgi:hypothetical protein